MSTRTDAYHGRQGGNWLPDDYEPVSLLTARTCDTCGQPMVLGQHRRHHLCDTSTIVGLACTCPPGCTDTHIGDTGRCNPGCDVCRLLAGAAHADIPEWRRTPPKDATTDIDEPRQLALEVAS